MSLIRYFSGLSMLFISLNLWANLDKAPASLNYEDGKAVFIDILRNYNEQIYDFKQKRLVIKSWLHFKIEEEGYPLFDLAAEEKSSLRIWAKSTKIRNNQKKISLYKKIYLDQIYLPQTTSGKSTIMRVMKTKLKPGYYSFKMTYTLTSFFARFRHDQVLFSII